MDATEARATILGSPDAGETGRARILVGAPVFQAVYPEPFELFLAMMVGAGRLEHFDIYVNIQSRQPVHDAMNNLFERAVAQQMHAVIWFDDDCGMPIDAIPRLVKHITLGLEFVAGVGFMRNYPHTTTIGRYFKEGITLTATEQGEYESRGFQWLDDYTRLPPLAEADFCGFPIAIVTTKALGRMKYPWFHVRDDEGGGCTHDVYFCKRLREAGIPVLVDTTLECRHLAPGGWMDFKTREWARLMANAVKTVPEAEALKARLVGAA